MCHAGVVGLEERELSHITSAAVGISGDRLKLLFGVHCHDRSIRLNGDRDKFRLDSGLERGSLSDPLLEQPITLRAFRQSHSATVRNFAGRFQEQQTACWIAGKETSAVPFFHQSLVVFRRVEAEHRQLKSSLTSASFGMARTGIASRFGEHRDDVVYKTDWLPGIIRADSYSQRQHKQNNRAAGRPNHVEAALWWE